jgi:uridine kinase
MDMYYYPHDRFPAHLDVTLEGKTYKNFDTPEALEMDLLVEHLTQLQSGKSVQIPHYDFGNNPTGKQLRTPGENIEPRDFIILDGIFGLVDERIRAMTDVSIFIDISPLNRMARRFVRDF